MILNAASVLAVGSIVRLTFSGQNGRETEHVEGAVVSIENDGDTIEARFPDWIKTWDCHAALAYDPAKGVWQAAVAGSLSNMT
jgi:hypothetical protein